ncbi:aldehyde reductase [Alcanivorax xiamenensis]|uniref:Aldehyde reductase n=1 Tax=Alcanivorax xiamenensis TaxID=1177156 RepID=A0ABQ6Y973_9GAMM|nr:aldo/keto reductase [Alcanivorax xiamenensis]KAF0805931.1 aldehyde reductase [Alcanivorax xiamenensis]
MQTLAFENGDTLPIIGLGTWKSQPGEVHQAVREALRAGYRHIDCAHIYGNEKEVGQALNEALSAGEVRREELWITSKLWNSAHAPEEVAPALRQTLSDLGLDYLDLYLIHWPVAHKPGVIFPHSGEDLLSLEERPIAATWATLEALVDDGLTRHIGVSNFSIRKLQALLETARIKPAMNQIELHPYLQQNSMLEFCHANGVHLTAYSPLGSFDRPEAFKAADEPVLLEDPVIMEIAERHQASPAQVLIRWATQRGTAVIPKSVNPERLRQNLAAADLELDGGDMDRIAALDKHRRYVSGANWAQPGSPYTLENLWDE